MKTGHGLAAVLAAALSAGCASFPPSSPKQRQDAAVAAIGNWSIDSRLAAARLIEEYGAPDRVEIGRLVWNDGGTWERTAVQDQYSYYDSDGSPEMIEQTIRYRVPAGKRDALKAFSDRLLVSKGGAELSARGSSEERNYLTINLAEDIIKGLKDSRQARLFYDETLELSLAGKYTPYTHTLLYPPEP